MGKFDDAEACYMRIQRVTELEPNTLAPLQELEGILAGLTDSELRIEATPSGNSAKITHPNYTRGKRLHRRWCSRASMAMWETWAGDATCEVLKGLKAAREC